VSREMCGSAYDDPISLLIATATSGFATDSGDVD
jgi:hypothetical protein